MPRHRTAKKAAHYKSSARGRRRGVGGGFQPFENPNLEKNSSVVAAKNSRSKIVCCNSRQLERVSAGREHLALCRGQRRFFFYRAVGWKILPLFGVVKIRNSPRLGKSIRYRGKTALNESGDIFSQLTLTGDHIE